MSITTLRVLYTKCGYMRFLGHLELMKTFERAFRRIGLPMRFSEGFSPLPKLTFAAPLSVGYASSYEVLEVQLLEPVPETRLQDIQLPLGIDIQAARYVVPKRSLMATVTHSKYRLTALTRAETMADEVTPAENDLQLTMAEFLAQVHIPYEKKSKRGKIRHLNMKDYIVSAAVLDAESDVNAGEIVVEVVLLSSNEGSLKPERFWEQFSVFGRLTDIAEDVRVERTEMYVLCEQQLIPLFDFDERL